MSDELYGYAELKISIISFQYFGLGGMKRLRNAIVMSETAHPKYPIVSNQEALGFKILSKAVTIIIAEVKTAEKIARIQTLIFVATVRSFINFL